MHWCDVLDTCLDSLPAPEEAFDAAQYPFTPGDPDEPFQTEEAAALNDELYTMYRDEDLQRVIRGFETRYKAQGWDDDATLRFPIVQNADGVLDSSYTGIVEVSLLSLEEDGTGWMDVLKCYPRQSKGITNTSLLPHTSGDGGRLNVEDRLPAGNDQHHIAAPYDDVLYYRSLNHQDRRLATALLETDWFVEQYIPDPADTVSREFGEILLEEARRVEDMTD